MAANRGSTEIENSGNSGPEDLIVEILNPGQLAQENQALKEKVRAMEVRMNEMMAMLQNLKGGTAAETIVVANSSGIASTLPPPGLAQTVTAIPHPGSGVNHPAHTPGSNAQYEFYRFDTDGYPQGYQFENSQPKGRYDLLEERLRAIEGSKARAKDARALCLVPDLVIPPKIKVPKFLKYSGLSCPSAHLTMYARRMTPYIRNDKLLIHYFQYSLAGASQDWYMQLQPSDICSWKDLSEAFLKEYEYNRDMAPDRVQLQHMSKEDDESFREYAQRWRSIAAQVKPPLNEKEMVYIFMETLPAIFYERLIGSGPTSFSDMIKIGARLEVGIKRGRIPCNPAGANNASDFPAKKSGEANAVMSQRRSTKFSLIPMSYTDLCDHLVSRNLISPRGMRPVQPPFPRGYDSSARCDFHSGAIGHSTENCKPFKYLVQGLIDTKQLTFDEGGEGLNPLRSELSGRDGSG